MSVNNKQFRFTFMVALLILYAYFKGYRIQLGDARAKTGHKSGSLHYVSLAIDINLFKDKRYIKDSEGHTELGAFWEFLGGSWGGRFESKDYNHYSIEHNGRR